MKTFKQFFEDNYVKFIDPDTKQEVKLRASDAFIKNVLLKQTDKDDRGSRVLSSTSYLLKILKQGQDTGVFDAADDVNDRDVRIIFNFIKDAVPPKQLHSFLKQLPLPELQDRLKQALASSKIFNFTDILDTTCDPSCQFADSLKKHPKVLLIRPASDRYATRGAAGPGEAFLAFMFSGAKPEGAGDLVLGDTYVELKGKGGRIGKKLDSNKSKLLRSYFPKGIKGPALDQETALNIANQYETMADFLNAVTGVPSLDEIDQAYFSKLPIDYLYSEYSGYRELVQLLGPIQMKHYFNEIANFQILAIYEGQRIIGFDRNNILSKNSEELKNMFISSGVSFKPKTEKGLAYDESGFSIHI
jgi:hypothetical protein